MKLSLRSIILSLAMTLPAFRAYNCVDFYLGEEVRVSNFMGDLLGLKALNAFIFSTENYYKDLDFEMGDYEENIAQWYEYCDDKKVSRAHIHEFLYDMDVDTFSANKNIYIQNNSFLNKIYHNKAAWTYLMLIKRKSVGTFKHTWDAFAKPANSYDYEPYEHPVPLPECDSLYKRCSDPFLKKRYAYQLLIASFYATDLSRVSELFEVHFANTRKDWMDYSAQHYFAYAHPKSDSLRLDAIIHGKDKVFANVDLLRRSEGFNKWVQVEKDPDTLSYLLAIRSFRNPGRNLKELKRITALYPQNRFIPFLILREVNKVEDWILTPKLAGFDSFVPGAWFDEDVKKNNWYDDLRYSQSFLHYVEQLALPQQHALFLKLTKVYLQLIVHNKAQQIDAEEFKYDPKYYLQAQVVNLLLKLHQPQVAKDVEAEILHVLHSCEEPLYRSQVIRTASQLMLQHPALRAKGFMLMAQSWLPKYMKEMHSYYMSGYNFYTDVYENASIADIDDIMAVLRKTPKSPFELMISQLHQDFYYQNLDGNMSQKPKQAYDTLHILDTKAMKYVQQDSLKEALAVYATFPPSYWKEYYYDDPFTFSVFDGHNHAHTDKAGYTKMAFLQKLIEYKQALSTNPNDPVLNYYMGNAYMALTYFGKSWYMIKNQWGFYDRDAMTKATSDVNRNYYRCEKALKYYEKASHLAKEPRLKRLLELNIAFIHSCRRDKPMQSFLSKEAAQYYKTIEQNCDLYVSYLDTYRHIGADYELRQQNPLARSRFFEWD